MTSISYIGPMGMHLWTSVLEGTPSKDGDLVRDGARAARASFAGEGPRITAVLGRDVIPGFRVFSALSGPSPAPRLPTAEELASSADPGAKVTQTEPSARVFEYNPRGAPVAATADCGPSVGKVVATCA